MTLRAPQDVDQIPAERHDPLLPPAKRLCHRRLGLRRGQVGRRVVDRHTVHSFDHVAVNDSQVLGSHNGTRVNAELADFRESCRSWGADRTGQS